MPFIHLLDDQVRELISAGEVVERPASVVKELIENSLDAGATKIEVELRRNGIGSVTVRDNGKGIDKEDIPVAFLRHATSKIENAGDLDAIGTLGFRGEALAAICAVSRVRLISRTPDSPVGHCYQIEGGTPVSFEECGAPLGTSITVSDIFYNTPARMKFLKKDVYEGNAIEEIVWHVALANPDVAFRLVRDGKQTLRTSGQGLYSAIFDLYPREIASGMLPVQLNDGNLLIEGYVCSPRDSKASRSLQHVCVNGRYIKSRTIQSAVEEAYKSFLMQGKYPSYVLSIWIPYEEVDVNVHPAKTEIRFHNERAVSSACYKAVRAAVAAAAAGALLETAPNVFYPEPPAEAQESAAPERPSVSFSADAERPAAPVYAPAPVYEPVRPPKRYDPAADLPTYEDAQLELDAVIPQQRMDAVLDDFAASVELEQPLEKEPVQPAPRDRLKVIGTLFDTYILSQSGDTVYFIDMHAAHERILYERIRQSERIDCQLMLQPVILTLSPDEKQALLDHLEELDRLGFQIEEIGEREIAVRGIPTYLNERGTETAVTELAVEMASGREDASFEAREWLYHSVACRAAIKAGHKCPEQEMVLLTEQILCGDVPKYCPHGRPVYFTMTRNEIEKKFGRIV